jgi:hypothetical protein
MLPSDERKQAMVDGRQQSGGHLGLALLICFHAVMCCISLVYVSHFHEAFHVFYDPTQIYMAIAVVAAFALVSCLFTLVGFSFGYFVGFYLYTMVLGYLWIDCFSDLNYDHRLGGLSAAASGIAFLLPALLISSPIRQTQVMSVPAFERLLTTILLLSAATIPISAIYNFRFVSLENIYDFRNELEFPTPLNYWIGITSNALLPFAFACFVMLGNHWRAAFALIVMLLFYPITLSKLAFFTPAWLLTIAYLSRIFDARIAVVLSLVVPMLLGVILMALFGKAASPYFDLVNLRMLAVPSNAMDVYNDFFFGHDLTYFCQITFMKAIISCPYQDQLSIVMKKAYDLGNFNASLFATEGIASVGVVFAPVAVFGCGLVIAFANRLSAGLPPRFILISSAILPQVFLNVPLTTVLLTHGAGLLSLLWYMTPREMFEQNRANRTSEPNREHAKRLAALQPAPSPRY